MLLFLVALLFSLVPVVVAPSPLLTETKLDPSLVELGPEYCIGETFTISSKIYDVSNLAGIGLAIEWNTTYLNYVEHIMKIPVETHPDGVLHEPILIVADTANPIAGTYDCAAASLGGPTFNGSGTVFEITFRVKDQPITPEPDVHFWIEYTLHDVADPGPGPIPPPPQNCHVIIHAYEEPPPSPPVGGTSVTIDFGKFSSWVTSTLLLVAAVITLKVKWNRRRKKH